MIIILLAPTAATPVDISLAHSIHLPESKELRPLMPEVKLASLCEHIDDFLDYGW